MSDLRTTIENASPRRSRAPWLIGAVVAVVVIVLIAVAAVASGDDDNAASGDGTPVRGGTLEFALIDYQRSPDPQLGTNYAESVVAGNVTDKLLWQDPKTGELTPWLATSWEHNDELTEFTFHLRDDVTFSDGVPFDAAAVKANFDQYIRGDQALGILPNGAILFPGYLDTETPDDHTVVLRFKAPLASALQAVSFTGNAGPGFLSPNTLKLSATERTDPTKVVGTGPFVYESWQEQVKTVLIKRKGYDWAPPALEHDGEAYLDKIVFNTIPEASVRTGSLVSGNIDATLDVGTTDEATLKKQGFSIVSRGVSGTAITWNLNAELFPTNDIAVRKAIQLGWDREAIEKTVLTDSYSVATSILAPSVAGYADHSKTSLRYDPEEAERLLDEAGWAKGPDGVRVKDGKKLEVKILGISNLVANKPSYESIQQDLKKIGIDIQLSVLPLADSAAEQAKARASWNGTGSNRSRNDPAALNLVFSPLISNNSFLFDGTSPGIDVEEATSVLGKLETTLDPAQREQYAAAAQDLIVDTYALANPIYNPSQVIAHSDKVHGIVFDAQSRNPFVNTWKSDGK